MIAKTRTSRPKADVKGANERTSVDFVASSEFEQLDERALFREHQAAVARMCEVDEKAMRRIRSLPPYLARLCEASLFTPDEERATFRRMNFAKFLVDKLASSAKHALSPVIRRKIARLQAIALVERNRAIQANLRLVVSIAKYFRCVGATFEDQLSEGIASLVRAVGKFDYQRGFRFSTYATQAVRRCLFRMISDVSVDRSRFVSVESEWFERSSIEKSVGTMTDDRWNLLKTTLGELLARLDEREQHVVRRRFGLDYERDPTTLQSLADEMGLSKERVRQLEQRALKKASRNDRERRT